MATRSKAEAERVHTNEGRRGAASERPKARGGFLEPSVTGALKAGCPGGGWLVYSSE